MNHKTNWIISYICIYKSTQFMKKYLKNVYAALVSTFTAHGRVVPIQKSFLIFLQTKEN